jgi:ankyrin repeat protein
MDTTRELLEAIKKGQTEVVKELLQKDRSLASTVDTDGVSALMKSVYYRKTDITGLLLSAGIDLNIFEAAATGEINRLKTLLATDPGLATAYSADGFTALGLASFLGHLEAVRILLAAGANPNSSAKNAMKVAPLHSAATGPHIEIARLLLASGAEPDARQQLGYTPMHEAALKGSLDLADLLVSHGADVNAANDDGKTALSIALSAGRQQMVDWLRANGAKETASAT